MAEVLYKEEVYHLVGAAIEVHKLLGCGFSKATYQEAMTIELAERSIPFETNQTVPVCYKGKLLSEGFVIDLVAYGKIILAIEVMPELTSQEEVSLINYLRASGYEVGLLLNFGGARLDWKRKVLTNSTFAMTQPSGLEPAI